MQPEEIARQLEATGSCICPGFLETALTAELRDELDRLHGAGRFLRAGTGQGVGLEVRDQIRRDEIHWLNFEDATPVQQRLWARLGALKDAFNRTLYLGLSEFEGHYAAYPRGGFYKRHRDSFQTDDARVVSLILYLNRDWQPADGGQLRIYESDSHVDIEPRGGTLVVFLSRELEHEVLLSQAARYSFSGWFKTRK